jgi:hypothetical protein
MHPISSGLPVCNRQYDSSVSAFGFGFALPCLSLEKMRQALDKKFIEKGIKGQENKKEVRVNHLCVKAKGKH